MQQFGTTWGQELDGSILISREGQGLFLSAETLIGLVDIMENPTVDWLLSEKEDTWGIITYHAEIEVERLQCYPAFEGKQWLIYIKDEETWTVWPQADLIQISKNIAEKLIN